MNWDLKECGDGFRARKNTGASANIRRTCLWPAELQGQGPGYDVNYKGLTIARILFENKGATVRTLEMCKAFPEISDLDLVEIALRISRFRSAAAAALN
jgi:hypothetical protein